MVIGAALILLSFSFQGLDSQISLALGVMVFAVSQYWTSGKDRLTAAMIGCAAAFFCPDTYQLAVILMTAFLVVISFMPQKAEPYLIEPNGY